MRVRYGLVAPAVLVAFAASLPAAVQAQPVLASPRADGLPAAATASGWSQPATRPISADGRYVAFTSRAGDVVASPVDANDADDAFVRDLLTGTTTLVSVRADGTATGNQRSTAVAISGNGRYVLFQSEANDLLNGDALSWSDVFVRDLQTNTTILVSVAADGVSFGNGPSTAAAITPDGRYVVFSSNASTLVAGDANGFGDVFVRDLQSATTVLASVNTAGSGSGNGASSAPAISADGRYVSFQSTATNLFAAAVDGPGSPDVFWRDLQAGVTQLVSLNVDGTSASGSSDLPAMSADGRYVLFRSFTANLTSTSDTNSDRDVFVRDMQTLLTTVESVSSTGTATGAGSSTPVAISSDGRYVTFSSTANDLVAGDGGDSDCFVRDRQLGATTLVSVDGGGVKGNAGSFAVAMTPDARYVLFDSVATNLASGDFNGSRDVFVRDRQLATTTLASVAAAGGPSSAGDAFAAAITADGRYVVITAGAADVVDADYNGAGDVVVRDLQGPGATSLASARAPLPVSSTPSNITATSSAGYDLSEDGRFVALRSFAADLLPVDTRSNEQAYLRDLQRGVTTLLSVNADGTAGGNGHSHGSGISADGRYVLLTSEASDLAGGVTDTNHLFDVYVRDLQAGVTTLVSVSSSGGAAGAFSSEAYDFTPDGRYVLFRSDAYDLVPNDLNGADVFVRDLQTATTTLVSASLAGASANGPSTPVAITADGRFVLFTSEATNLVSVPVAPDRRQVYVRDMQTGTTELVSVNASGSAGGNSICFFGGAITADGRYVMFDSAATDLGGGTVAPPGSNVFVRDRQTGTTSLVSRNSSGTGSGNGSSSGSALSANGRYVAFGSVASNLVAGDANGAEDVFLRDLQTGATMLVSVNSAGTSSGNGLSRAATMTADGRLVGFHSLASNLVAGSGDTNGRFDAFVRDMSAGTTFLISAHASGIGDRTSGAIIVNPAGTRLVFLSTSTNLAANNLNSTVGSSRVDLQACKLEYSIVSPK